MTLDKDRVYWIWVYGHQVQIAFDPYSREWYGLFNGAGLAK